MAVFIICIQLCANDKSHCSGSWYGAERHCYVASPMSRVLVPPCVCASPAPAKCISSPLAGPCCFVCTSQDGRTPLHCAVYDGRVDVVRALLEAGAKIEAAGKVFTAFALGGQRGRSLEKDTHAHVFLEFMVRHVGRLCD